MTLLFRDTGTGLCAKISILISLIVVLPACGISLTPRPHHEFTLHVSNKASRPVTVTLSISPEVRNDDPNCGGSKKFMVDENAEASVTAGAYCRANPLYHVAWQLEGSDESGFEAVSNGSASMSCEGDECFAN